MQSGTLGNGLVQSFQYDQDYRQPQIVTDNGAGGNARQNLILSYDGMDNITVTVRSRRLSYATLSLCGSR